MGQVLQASGVRTRRDGEGAEARTAGRIGVFDVVRGFSVISMVLFHFCYDLRFIAGLPLPWFAPPLQDVWRASISWTFLFVAGCMCPLSRSNLRRGLVYSGAALGIWAVTSIADVDTPISFGIIYCMAACTLVAWTLARLDALPRGRVAAAVLAILFLSLQGLPHGTIGLGPFVLELPSALYQTPWLAWLGLPGAGFASGDYYPLLPYLCMYLAGAALGWRWARRGYPAWAREARVRLLSLVGQRALLVYVVHQPVLLVIALLVAGALG